MLSYISSTSLLTVTHTRTGIPSDYPIHSHRLWELYCFLSGSGCQCVENRNFPLFPHSLLLIRPGRRHQMFVDRTKTYERLVVHFDTSLFGETPPSLLTAASEGEDDVAIYRSLEGEHHRLSRLLIERLCTPAFFEVAPDETVTAALRLLLREVAADPADNCPTPTFVSPPLPLPTDTDLVGRMLTYIDLHLTELSGLEIFESEFFFSRSYLNRVFRQTTGSSLWDYVLRKRLQTANSLLKEGKSATAVAGECGFRDYSSFYRQYRKYFGTAPTETEKEQS